MQVKPEIRFINHASIQVITEEVNIVFDPWYWGKVFNETWSLLSEGHHNLKSGITHILVSHEHPDHLSFFTLKSLKEKGLLSKDCQLIFPARSDSSVRRAIEKLGIDYREVGRGKINSLKLSEQVECVFYGEVEDGDHSIVLSCNGVTILNQNDHYPEISTCHAINQDWPKLDFLFTQFSLAGYYGNQDDPTLISHNGHEFHKQRLIDYSKIFKPKFLCPFASYVYFCDEFNSYLNSFIVTPAEISEIDFGSTQLQLLNFGDIVSDTEAFIRDRNKVNLEILKSCFEQSFQINKSQPVDIVELMNLLEKICTKIPCKFRLAFLVLCRSFKSFKRSLSIEGNSNSRIGRLVRLFRMMGINSRFMYIELSDMDQTLVRVDCLGIQKPSLVNHSQKIDLKIPSRQLFFGMKFPWGVDTVNITGTAQHYTGRADVFMKHIQVKNKR